jgi:hypothetical protein
MCGKQKDFMGLIAPWGRASGLRPGFRPAREFTQSPRAGRKAGGSLKG